MKIWALIEELKEGKYLVVRRDGTVPYWPHFVIGGDDPCAAAALRAYAVEAENRGFAADYVDSVLELANQFEARTGGKADPDAGPHRQDLTIVLAMMRHEVDLAQLEMEFGLSNSVQLTAKGI